MIKKRKMGSKRMRKKITLFKFLFILGGAILLLFLLMIVRSRGKIWNRYDQFNLALAYPQRIFLLTVNPAQETAFLISFPGDLKVKAFGGYGIFGIDKIDDLARQEGKQNLTSKTLEYNFGLPLDFWFFFDFDKNLFSSSLPFEEEKDLFSSVRNQLFRLSFSLKRISFSDRVNLFLTSVFLRNRFLIKETVGGNDKRFLSKTEEGYGLNKEVWDNWSSTYLADPALRNERLLLGIYNAAGHPGLATEIAQVLTNEGMAIGVVRDSQQKVDNCLIAFKKKEYYQTRTFSRLQGLFSSCEVKIMPEEVFDNSTEINIYLGKKFLEN